MPEDPRYAPDLRAAAQNADGSYSLPRAMAWLSEAMNPGQGVAEAEVRVLIEQAQARRKAEVLAEQSAKTCEGPPHAGT